MKRFHRNIDDVGVGVGVDNDASVDKIFDNNFSTNESRRVFDEVNDNVALEQERRRQRIKEVSLFLWSYMDQLRLSIHQMPIILIKILFG